ncbi:MAG: macro domain-containing protein [Ruminococcaceae bacterium]|nr:macro domain-containing protein [Oscillospiraceae bacterium]
MPLSIIRQDITKIRCDAIVNPTNEYLSPGGGTDAAVHTAAGPKLSEACAKLSPCVPGRAVITPGYNLPCKYVIHTVGPVWQNGTHGERELLVSCYTASLALAKKHKCRSVAIPLISSGTYGCPKDLVLKIALETIGRFLQENEMDVTVVVYDKDSYALSRELADEVTAYIDDRYTGDDEPPVMKTNRPTLSRRRMNLSGNARCDDSSPMMQSCAEPEDMAEMPVAACMTAPSETKSRKATLDEMLRAMDKGFAETLFDYIDAKGMDDVECYKRANIDRKTFSKIKCNKNYKPSKQTVLSFAIALRLTLEETNHLLNTVGMALSRSSKFDVIIEYFIKNGKYDIYEINETLFTFDQVLLGA